MSITLLPPADITPPSAPPPRSPPDSESARRDRRPRLNRSRPRDCAPSRPDQSRGRDRFRRGRRSLLADSESGGERGGGADGGVISAGGRRVIDIVPVSKTALAVMENGYARKKGFHLPYDTMTPY